MSDQSEGSSPSSKSSTSSASSVESLPSTSKNVSNLTRIQRNVAEKQRRDKLNGYISELANIVPMVSMSSKRLDKTSILRLSAAHLRLSKSPLSGTKKLKKSFKWCPNFLKADQVREILESVDGFLIVTSSSGKILFTSSSVERYLGHQNIDMIGHSLFIFVHPEDLDNVKDEMERLLSASLKCGDSGKSPRCSFQCRLKEKGQPRSEVATYQFVHFAGDMTIVDDDSSTKNPKSTAIVTHIFKAFVRIVDASPYCQLSLEEATADEYVTRHGLDGVIIFADHRLSTITGHLPREVQGQSAYEYILPDDISIALFAHHLMFSSDKGTGMIVYRLRTRDNNFVYLKSVGCLQYDRATSQVDHFVCVNQHLSDAEGESQLKYFVDRFIPHIRDSEPLDLQENLKAFKLMGVKPPSFIGGIKDVLSSSKLPRPDDPKVNKSDGIISDNLQNKVSRSTAVASSVLSHSKSNSVSCNEFTSNSVLTSQKSSPLKMSRDRNNNTGTSTSATFRDTPYKNKREVQILSRKKRANNNIGINAATSNVKTSDSSISNDSGKTFLITQPKVLPSENITALKILSLNGLHASHLSSQNANIKKAVLNTLSNPKKSFSLENKILQYKNHATDYIQSIPKHTGIHINNSILDQMCVSEVPAPKNLKESSLKVSQANDMCNQLVHTLLKKENHVKVCTNSDIPHSANVYSLSTGNSDGKTNIMPSPRPVVSINNDLQIKTSKTVIGNHNEPLTVGNHPVSLNKVKHPNFTQLTSNVNTVVLETNLWPAESAPESSPSNVITEETLIPPIECPTDVNDFLFMPEEEINKYIKDADLSSFLDSALPFDDSSLPSVDGWSEYLRPEDILSSPNPDVPVHIDPEQPLINPCGEKPFGMW